MGSAEKVVFEPAYKDVALAGVYEISKILTGAQSLDRTLGAVIAVLASFMQMRRGFILALDEDGEPEITASSDASAKGGGAKTLLPQKVIDHIVATGVPLVIEDISSHQYFTGTAYRHLLPPMTKVSFLGVPIKVDGVAKGTLTVDREWNNKLDFRLEDDVRLLTMVANLIGQAMRMHALIARDRDRLIKEQHRLEKALVEVGGSKPAATPRGKFDFIVGESPGIKTLLQKIEVAARSNATVLLRGETGAGKELFARAVHENSPRAKGPFVKVNCAALPESVIESELFGHEKGSFTGAVGQRAGRFELADGGTLFLDEIGEISASFQAKLLRVLQEGEFERVGGAKTLKVDVRIVCATNRNLEEAVARGDFRADLYYRINVVTLLIPPLRERPGDIKLLAKRFLEQFTRENGLEKSFSSPALERLSHCAFPGNVRELENCVRRTATLAGGAEIIEADLACAQGCCLSATLWKGHNALTGLHAQPTPQPTLPPITAKPAEPFRPPVEPHRPAPEPPAPEPPLEPVLSGPCADHAAEAAERGLPIDCPSPDHCPVVHPGKSERERLIEALEKTGWVQAKAARLLGLTPRQIGYALRKQNIDIKKF
ncbi:Nif-specific regulatory protein [Rhodoblastus acidophilus]|uniref:Nif-specific regulatory protein n=1 Tax=Rhodoblastus acidophilus TaxID=1074 RepID=A0A212R379_RHOAC|nr:nif-specific transcriptional activator NifA [Rhodoblastus acidophilus]AVI02156.1 nitrogenase (molybdenum-iron)-specific transcriptional regulator [Rhodoblastus acidophilus]PPQ40273.1 nif-specific transcriptional activator NifA [Rhodoblastus acidophilus]RAI19369.1 nif-specific transcriptional activator NifA [Rhodoblastus acidophilus]SNB66463.1 Nif-specific regulatory protein [Rhodoblastus acidophilus]